MKKYLEILRKCSLFDQIEANHLLSMLNCFGAKIETFDKKYTVLAEGCPAETIGIVLSGSVQIIQEDYYGNRSIISILGASEVFAEAFACSDVRTLPISVIAGEYCEIMLINCHHILHTCRNNCGFHNQLIFNLMKDIATKAILFHQKIEINAKRTTREKLMTYLMIQAKKENSSSFDIPFDRQELADYLEVDRSGLSAEISKLRNEGILQNSKKHFILLQSKFQK